MIPHRAAPVVLEMVEPVRGLEQRRAIAGARVGETDAVGVVVNWMVWSMGRTLLGRTTLLARGVRRDDGPNKSKVRISRA